MFYSMQKSRGAVEYGAARQSSSKGYNKGAGGEKAGLWQGVGCI